MDGVTPTISVIVPAFDEAEDICLTLDPLLAQAHPAREIIVADDASTDGTARIFNGVGVMKASKWRAVAWDFRIV